MREGVVDFIVFDLRKAIDQSVFECVIERRQRLCQFFIGSISIKICPSALMLLWKRLLDNYQDHLAFKYFW